MAERRSGSGDSKKAEEKGLSDVEIHVSSPKTPAGRQRRHQWRRKSPLRKDSDSDISIDDSDLDPDFKHNNSEEGDSDDDSPDKGKSGGKKPKKVDAKVNKGKQRGESSVGGVGGGGVASAKSRRVLVKPENYESLLFDCDTNSNNSNSNIDNDNNEESVEGVREREASRPSAGDASGGEGEEGTGTSGTRALGTSVEGVREGEASRPSAGDASVGEGEEGAGTSGTRAVGSHSEEGSNNSSSTDNAGAGVPNVKRVVAKRGRKSGVHKSEWSINVSKRKRNLGEEYISHKTRKLIPARKVGAACKDGCFEKIGRDKIEDIHKSFWSIGDYNRQNEYLIRCVTEKPFKRKYTKKDVSKRPAKLVYSVTHGNQDFEVCREGFLSIFDIKRGKLDLIVKKLRDARAGFGIVSQDGRGRAVPANKYSGAKLAAVHEFIGELPVVSSHYTRAKAPLRQYLPAGGSITGLYSEFQVWMELEHPDVEVVPEKYFRKLFTRDYNIEFAPPKTDECNFCSEVDVKIDALKDATDARSVERRTLLENNKKQHLDNAKIAQEMLKDDLNFHPLDNEFRAIAIDLQQQQMCPKMPVNKAYYTSKLWFRNFCVFDITKNKVFMFPWDETVGSRGANEIASCIMRWLRYVREVEGKNITKLRIFADNCGGQNKNIHIILFFLQLIQQNSLKRVDIIYLVSGHSFMPCDRAFGVVEKYYRRHGYICSVSQYIGHLKKACKKNTYIVMEMDRSLFFDVKVLEPLITNRSKGLLSKARQFVLKDRNKDGFFIKNHYNFNDSDMTYIDLRKGKQAKKQQGRGRPPSGEGLNIAHAQLPFAYPTERKLKKKKIKSLKTITCMIPFPEARTWLCELLQRQEFLHADDEDALDSDDGDSEDDASDTLLTERRVIRARPPPEEEEEDDSTA